VIPAPLEKISARTSDNSTERASLSFQGLQVHETPELQEHSRSENFTFALYTERQ
jgi:hypothetical protein